MRPLPEAYWVSVALLVLLWLAVFADLLRRK
jgi:hypothetical protein